MRTRRYGTYRNCEICRDGRGWFFTAPVRTERFGEPVAVVSKRIRLEDGADLFSTVVRRIDEYMGETA